MSNESKPFKQQIVDKVSTKIVEKDNATIVKNFMANRKQLQDQAIKLDEIKKSVQIEIDELCNNNNLLCGIVLNEDEVVKLLKTIISVGKPITIKYNLYFNE